MRLSRRRLLTGLAMAPVALAGEAEARLQQPAAIELTARPIPAFLPSRPTQTQFGALTFRSGLVLSARHPDFGGLSGLWRSGDGQRIVAVTDQGHWLTATLSRHQNGRLTGLGEARLAPILNQRGQPLWRTRSLDCEGLAITPDGTAHVAIERTHEILRFAFGREGVEAKGQSLPLPREVKRLPSNRGLEGLTVLPPRHALAGALMAVSERSGGPDEPTAGWLIGGARPGAFQVRRRDGYDITDLAALPDGDVLLLERWFMPWRGVGMRIRRVAGKEIQPGAMLDGPVLIEADLGHEIDNMEGMVLHREAGTTIITLISDDNFSPWQRTLLLEFALPD